MQGFILKITPMKNEDLIVKILTQSSLRDFYRFYGARHSVINLGYKIDFEEKPSAHFMPQARSIMHLANSWERDFERVLAWQKFISLLAKHLQDVEEIDEFYFGILENAAKKMARQNPLRVLLEAYAQILKFEGRLRLDDECFLCGLSLQNLDFQNLDSQNSRNFENSKISQNFAPDSEILDSQSLNSQNSNSHKLDSENSAPISLARAFLPTHTHCINGEIFNKDRIFQFLNTAQTIHLSQAEISNLWQIFCLGM